ncbi:MAG: hypothetical protein ABII18_07690 [bacterium]|nr:hypothetical protein [bacterium]
MKQFLSTLRVKFPLFSRLLLFQLVALAIGSVILFGLYVFLSDHFLTEAISDTRHRVKPRLEVHQEQWRTWKYMKLDDALQPALNEFQEIYGLSYLDVVDIIELPKKISQYDVIVPEATDPVINYVVYAKLSQENLSYVYSMNRLMLSVTIAIFILFLSVVLFSARLLYYWCFYPIGKLNEAIVGMKVGQKLKISHIEASGEIHSFLTHIKQLSHLISNYERMTAMGRLSTQIAYVLRPYVVDLKKAFGKEGPFTEDDLRIIKRAIEGIENINNDLHDKSRRLNDSVDRIEVEEESSLMQEDAYTTELLYSLVDSLVSEKKMQYQSYSDLRINLVAEKHSYGTFVKVKPFALRKILSHIVDVFAESQNCRDHVMVKLDGNYHSVRLTVRDRITADIDDHFFENTSGHNDFIAKHDKAGMFAKAHHILKSWGCSFALYTAQDQGTMVSIELPRQTHQTWLLSGLELEQQSLVVILEDDQAVHRVWDRRLQEKGIKKDNILHFYDPEEFSRWFQHERKPTQLRTGFDTLLVSFKFIDSKQTGLDVVGALNLKSRSVLVTSLFKKPKLKNYCAGFGIKILPKSLISIVPIIIADIVEKPDCILIAEDEHVQVYWRMEARMSRKSILTFNDPGEFFQNIHNYDRSVPIYVTTTFTAGVRGEDISLHLNKAGFKNIYIVSSRDKQHFPTMPWIKDIVDKEPPWKLH